MPAIGTGDIEIEYAVTDFEGNTITLAVSYSADGGNTWNEAAVTGNVTGIALENYKGQISRTMKFLNQAKGIDILMGDLNLSISDPEIKPIRENLL